MKFDKIDENNFMLYAAQSYDNPGCQDTAEFIEDLNRIKYIRKLITRYVNGGDLKDRLILNHVTVLYNVFGPEATVRMIFYRMPAYLKYVKPFLVMLNLLPEKVVGIGRDSKQYFTDEIPMDQGVVDALRRI